MAPLTLITPRQPGDTAVYCPECAYDLAPWEVHLLRTPHCEFCGEELEIAEPVDFALVH